MHVGVAQEVWGCVACEVWGRVHVGVAQVWGGGCMWVGHMGNNVFPFL